MNKKELEMILDSALSGFGFRKRKITWYRQNGEILQVVDLQKSAYGKKFFVNICCVPDGMMVMGMPTPKEKDCPIRIRLTSIYSEKKNEIEAIFDLEDISIEDDRRASLLGGLIDSMIISSFEGIDSISSLRDAVESGIFKKGAVTVSALRYFGIVSDAGSE